MFNQFLSQPLVFEVRRPCRLRFRLPPQVSDFVLLQLLGVPLAEVVVSEWDSGKEQAVITVRHQPFLELHWFEDTQSEMVSATTLSRTLGQGLRLYFPMGIAPERCASSLREGVELNISLNGACGFSLQAGATLDLLSLERDLRVFQEPRELMMAKALLGRQYDYGARPEMLAIHLTELERIRHDLLNYLKSESGRLHPGLSAESLELDAMLQKKRQWLMRVYSQSMERPSYARAANETSDLERLRRQIECYELLAPPKVTDMVRQLADEEN
jgi:hypothetical protein